MTRCLGIKHLDFVKRISKECKNKNILKKLISSASKGEIDAISEIVYNILQGNIPCGTQKLKKLRPLANDIRFIASRRNSLSNRKTRIVKKGGAIFTALIPAAIAAITALIAK